MGLRFLLVGLPTSVLLLAFVLLRFCLRCSLLCLLLLLLVVIF